MKFADGHSDFLSKAIDLPKDRWDVLASNPEKLKKGCSVFQIYAIFVSTDSLPAKKALRQVQLFKELEVKKVFSASDVPDPDDDELHVMLALEGLYPIDGYPELLYIFHDLGVRMASLVWSRINHFADGSLFAMSPTGRGLSPYGRVALKIMEELGWILDVSHLNDPGIRDALRSFQGMVVATHSCSRALCDMERNLPDDLAREIAERGGIIGVNFSPRFLTCEGRATVDDLLRHIEHFVGVAGEDHVGLGSDFDGLPSYPEGLESAEKLPFLGEKLVERFGKDVAEKIAYKNWLRVVKESLK